jgi:hypothetical protein
VALHPATLLAGWGLFVLMLQQVPVAAAAMLSAIILPIALLRAPRRTRSLLRRARWLLLSIVLLFAFATPGRPLLAGTTAEGLGLAAEHGLRLTLLLASLAIVHEILGNAGLLTGLHLLLAPLASWRQLRERIVTRLLLVLDYVENGPGPGGWRAWLSESKEGGCDRLQLPAYPFGMIDRLVLATLASAAVAWSVLP